MPRQMTLGQAYQDFLEIGYAKALVEISRIDFDKARQIAACVLEGDAIKAMQETGVNPNIMVTVQDDGSCPQVKEIIDATTPPPGKRSSGLATGRIVSVDATDPREHITAQIRAKHLDY